LPHQANRQNPCAEELADFLGTSLPTVDAYVRRGCPFATRGSKGKEWAFNSRDVVEWLKADAVEREVGNADNPDIDAARLRKVLAEAQLAELELSKKRGRFVDIELVGQDVMAAFSLVRTNFLAFPHKLASQMPDLVARDVFRLASDEVDALLTHLSETKVLDAAQQQDDAG